jgi:tetratricopeptide (TPR) repeat protein
MPPQHDDSIERLLAQAEQLRIEGLYEEAIVILEHILARNPDHITTLEEVADNELSLERYDRAERAAKRAITIDPKSFDAHYIIGFVASHHEKWAESVVALKIANQLEPNNPEILRCLGWSLFSGEAVIEGMVTLERALNLEPDNPLILCDLGVVYLKMKEFDKARALLKRALDLDPENIRARECLEMADRIAEKD